MHENYFSDLVTFFPKIFILSYHTTKPFIIIKSSNGTNDKLKLYFFENTYIRSYMKAIMLELENCLKILHALIKSNKKKNLIFENYYYESERL